MGYDSTKGSSKLGGVLNDRMRDMMSRVPVPLDVGVIQEDYSLKTNKFAKPIPKGSYSVCRQLTLGETDTHLTFTIKAGNPNDGTHSHGSSGTHGGHLGGDGSHTHTNEGAHRHDVLIPEKMRSLKPGDRVLVAWVGNEAIAVDIILKS